MDGEGELTLSFLTENVHRGYATFIENIRLLLVKN